VRRAAKVASWLPTTGFFGARRTSYTAAVEAASHTEVLIGRWSPIKTPIASRDYGREMGVTSKLAFPLAEAS
jgi:hypothetical protein